MMNENNKEVIAIVRLRSRVETRTANLRDDYQLLKSMYEAQRGNEIIEDWIRRMQRETYINIDPAWMNCEFQFPGWLK
jgi:peptidyl-prolyl cis-trans isomerase SurA